MKKIYSLLAAIAVNAFTFTANAQNELVVGDVKVGDLISLSDGSQWYVGTNEITNGNFDANPEENNGNIVGWTVGNGYGAMTTSNFKWFATGGYDGGAYIQAAGHTGAGGNNSIANHWPLETNTRYYFSFYVKNQGANNQYSPVVTLTDQESTGGGQNENKYLIGMSGNSADGALGFSTDGGGDWAQTACSFNSEEYTWLQCNARWLGSSHCYDGFFLAKLYDPSTTSQSMVAFLALQSEISKAESKVDDYADYSAIAGELSDFTQEKEIDGVCIVDITDESDLTTIQAAIDAIQKEIETAEAAVANIAAFEKLMNEASLMMEAEVTYPGIDDFGEAYGKWDEYMSNGYETLDSKYTSIEYVSVALKGLQDDINTYRFSQEASEENPADYSFYISNPSFDAKGPWYIGSSGGDQRVKSDANDNEGNTISCWNAWRNTANFTNNTIQQDLTDLPNGWYTVSADMNTQDGCLTDQHVFAASSVATSASSALTVTGWSPMAWETLTTAKVLVVDGNLKIGATSNGMEETPAGFTDYRGGWFCVTNFKLNYLGKASDAEMAAAIAERLSEVSAYADNMRYAGDAATLKEAVATAKSENNLADLSKAYDEAKESEADYDNVQNGSLKNMKDIIANPDAEKYPHFSSYAQIAQVPVDAIETYIASSEATYKESQQYTAITRYYIDNILPAIENAYAKLADAQSGKATIQSAINEFEAVASVYDLSSDVYADAITALNTALQKADNEEIKIEDGADLTAYIMNPNIDSESNWTFVKVKGNTNTAAGQEYNGGSSRYLDSWDPAGVRYSAYQVIEVPNGKYTITNIMRSSANAGAYLFASDKAPIVTEEGTTIDPEANTVYAEAVPVATVNAKYGIESEEETTVYNDAYGEIYMAAADRVMSALGLTAIAGNSIYDLAVEQNNGSEDCPEGVNENDWNIIKANGGKGRGWFNNSVDIEITNNTLVIGVTCDYAFMNKTEEEAYAGSWYSADNFTLTLVKVGDNTQTTVTIGDITNLIDKYLASEGGVTIGDITSLIDKYLAQ